MAEDDPSVRLALEFVLKYEGFDVVFAEDGIKALEMARNARPDIILLDHLMPKMDGREVLGELKGDENTSGIPVLVLTGMPERDSENWEGAEFVGKPFTPDELIAKINAALGESDRSG